MKCNSYTFLYLLSFVFLFPACNKSSKKYSTRNNSIEIDSTLWYDSTYESALFRIDTFFTNRNEYFEFNGNVLVAVNGRVIYEKSFGTKTPMSTSAIKLTDAFQLASITKPFTATAILQLCQAGKLNLDDTLNKFIPKFPYLDITIKQLLCHRSGLPEYFHFTERLLNGRMPEKLYNDSIINLLISKIPKKEYPPNFKYDYCNTGYILLAHVIEKVSGKRYADYMNDSIFKPLGMNKTFVWENGYDALPKYALKGFEEMETIDYSVLNDVLGDKGIYSTCRDMLVFDQALRNGKLLSKEWQKKAYTANHDELDESGNYGLGWRTINGNNRNVVYHAGWWKGFRTIFVRDLKNGVTIIALNNIRRGPYVNAYELLDMFYNDNTNDTIID